MADNYGSDYITIVDEDGTEFELEVLRTFEYNGATYQAVVLAGIEQDPDMKMEVSVLKVVEEDGEPILYAIEDDTELEAVEHLLVDLLYESEDEEE